MTPEKQSLPLIERIYEAALDPSRWQGFVEELAEAYGGAAVVFSLQLPHFPHPEEGLFQFGVGDASYRGTRVKHGLVGLPWEEARRTNFVGRFGLASEVFPDADVGATLFYQEWMKPRDLAPVCPIGHTIAIEDGDPAATLMLFRRGSAGAFEQADLALGDLLVPHLAQAVRIHHQGRTNAALAEALDRLPTGVVLLDSRGHRVFANRAADRVLALEDGFSLDETGPRAALEEDQETLELMVAQAIEAHAAGEAPLGSAMTITRPSGRRGFPIMATPLLTAPDESMFSDAVAALYVSDLDAHSLPRNEALRSLYALTGAEIELVELLCDGCSLEEAAHRRGVTMNTARSQLKQVFLKTKTSRQSELVRLVLAGIAPVRDA